MFPSKNQKDFYSPWSSFKEVKNEEDSLLADEFKEFERQIQSPGPHRNDIPQTSITINNSLFIPSYKDRFVKSEITGGEGCEIFSKGGDTCSSGKYKEIFNSHDTNVNAVLGHDYQDRSSARLEPLTQTSTKLCKNESMEFRKLLFAADAQNEVDMRDVELCMSRLVERIEGYPSDDKKIITARETSLGPIKLSIQKFASKNIKTTEGMLGSQFNNEQNTATKLSLFLPKLLAFHGFNYLKLQLACVDSKGHFSWTRGYTNLTQSFEDALVEDIWTKFWPNSISIKLISKMITDHFDTTSKNIEKEGTSFMIDDTQRRGLAKQVKEVMRQVYVGNLEKYITSEAKLYSEFSCLGPIISIVMSSNQGPLDNSLHKGFAFVNYETPDAAELALEMTGISIDRRSITIGRPSQYNKDNKLFNNMVSKVKKEAEYQNRIYIANLNPNMIEKDIRNAFKDFGKIEDCLVPKFTGSFINRGICYLKYNNKLSVHMAISTMDFKELEGHMIRVIGSIISSESLEELEQRQVSPPAYSIASPSSDIIRRYEEQSRGIKTNENTVKMRAMEIMRRIYVGNLNAAMTTELQLHAEFSPFGPIRTIDLSYHMPVAYAFIEYEIPDAAELALEMDGVSINDRDIMVRSKAVDQEIYKYIIEEMRQLAGRQHRIYISNLTSTVHEQELRSAFEVFGTILDLQLISFNKSNRIEKFCYIQFSNNESKQRAMNNMTFCDFKGKKIRIGHCISTADEIRTVSNRFEPVPKEVLIAKSKAENKILGISNQYKRKNNDSFFEISSESRAKVGDLQEIEIKLEKFSDPNTEENELILKRKLDWMDNPSMNHDIKFKKYSRWSESAGHGSTYAHAVPTSMPPGLSKCQEEAFLWQIKVSEITQEIQTNRKDLLFDQRKILEERRHQYILRIKELIDNYKPPADYTPLAFQNNMWKGIKNMVTEDVFIPQCDSINYMGLLLGPKGKFIKAQEQETNAKIYIRGMGSEKVGKKFSKLYTSTLFNTSFNGEQPLHVHIEGKEETDVQEAARRIKCLINEITNNPKFVIFLQQLQMQDRVLYANDETPINYVPATFFEDGKWSDLRRLPFEDVLIPESEQSINKQSIGYQIRYQLLVKKFKELEQATNTKMMIMGRGTNWENDMPPHVHVVAKSALDVQEGVKRIKYLLQIPTRKI